MVDPGNPASATQRLLRNIVYVLLTAIGLGAVAALLLRWDRIGTLHDPRWQVQLTLIGLAAGVWLGSIQARAAGRFRKTAAISAIGILFSQACYLILVWTSWKMDTLVWRCWWVSLVAAVTATHIVWLRLAAAPDRRKLMRFTVICALLAASMLGSLAFRRQLLASVETTYIVIVILASMGSLGGSLVLWLRGVRLSPSHRIPRPVKIGWMVAAQVALIAVAFYAGRITAPPADLFGFAPSALTRMTPDELEFQVRTDLERLKIIAQGLEELDTKVAQFSRELAAKPNREVFTDAEDDALRAHFMSYLAYRDALLRLAAMYAGFESVRHPEARARCMLVGYGAGMLVYDYSLKLVSRYRDSATVRRKLNEPDTRWGIPAGMFDRIYENVVSQRNADALAEVQAYYQTRRADWAAAQVLPEADLAWLDGCIERCAADISASAINPWEARLEQLVSRVRNDTYTPVYAAQSLVSVWIGDTRLVQWQPLIRKEQIAEMQGKLQPGDILLERRNWFLSNAFLPGFWPHSALYVGTVQDLEKAGLVRRDALGKWTSDDPNVLAHLEEYLHKAPDGEAHTVIEAVSEGVVFNSLGESMHADYVAVLRPRLPAADKARAIARAFAHAGKAYDFEFDFDTADKLVCTELVYRSYDGLLNFRAPYLQKVMGRYALPAVEIARKFRDERASAKRELDFVMFLDAVPSQRVARLADEETFCTSVDRPRGFND